MTKEPWAIKLNQTPVWYYVRPFAGGGESLTTIARPYIRLDNLIHSFFSILYFVCVKQFFVESVFFSAARRDCVDFHAAISTSEKCELFLQYENRSQWESMKNKTCDFLTGLRFLCRIIGRFPTRATKEAIEQLRLSGIDINSKIEALVESCQGDLYFNRLLSLVLRRGLKVYYSCAVVPQSEKFEHLMKSCEVQHGVICQGHMSYSSVPFVKNRIITYHPIYTEILREIGYSGDVSHLNFRTTHLPLRQKCETYDVAIFTQPNCWPTAAVEKLFVDLQLRGFTVRMQKHPRDYCEYKIDPQFFVQGLHPAQIKSGVVFSSTLIEDLLMHDKQVIVFDPAATIDLNAPHFKVYMRFARNKKIEHVFSVDQVISLVESIR
jgi:hypothetical protein